MFKPALLLAALLALPAHAANIGLTDAGEIGALIKSGHIDPGDTVTLSAGTHGYIRIVNQTFDPPLTITGPAKGKAIVQGAGVRDASGLVLKNFSVRPPLTEAPYMLDITGERITLSGLDIATADDTSGWTEADWKERPVRGIFLRGDRITVRDNHIHAVHDGIATYARNALIENNLIEDFTEDGIRALGDHSIYRGNTIRGCMDVSPAHEDGIQAWSSGPDGRSGTGVLRDVLIENNRILNDRPAMPSLTCQMQGLGFFDGMYEDVTIRNNHIEVNHWHGITVMGAKNVTITGNTVLDAAPGDPGPPWISIAPHKDGRQPTGSRIENNVVQKGKGGGPFMASYPGVRRSGDKIWVKPRP